MPRRYRRYRRTRALRSVRYSSETTSQLTSLNTAATSVTQQPVQLIVAEQGQGVKKIKNITISIAPWILNPPTTNIPWPPVDFVVVFVPQGQNPNTIKNITGSNSYYDPNQNVVMYGQVEVNKVSRFRTRLSRNLNSGDSLYIIFLARNLTANPLTYNVEYVCNYAICYN